MKQSRERYVNTPGRCCLPTWQTGSHLGLDKACPQQGKTSLQQRPPTAIQEDLITARRF